MLRDVNTYHPLVVSKRNEIVRFSFLFFSSSPLLFFFFVFLATDEIGIEEMGCWDDRWGEHRF